MAFYVATARCGCLVAAVVDDGQHPKDVAESVAEYIRNGWTVERTERCDLGTDTCPHTPKWGKP